ncbi:F-box domain containing protein [Parasponia andersonii]|uniref:F-box domain containing protein n=1 Tax=Parasponia andersonii TaxID=3476 RepID=A0A2P5B1J7_PARAD|nr:F-box domain containing protein [Parasponia andersonii]
MGQRNTPDLSSADHDQRTHAMGRRRTTAINSYASSKFPREIIEEIMSYLPPKSLMRFKCVSKSWYTLINTLMKNPELVAKHLRYSRSNNKIFSHTAGLIFINSRISCQCRKLDNDDRHREPMFYLLSIFNDYHRDRDHDLRFLAENINLQDLIIEAKEDIYYVATHHCNGSYALLTLILTSYITRNIIFVDGLLIARR